MKYKKKPVIIDAFEFGAGVPENIEKWAVEAVEKKIIEIVVEKEMTSLIVHTLEGNIKAAKGDYIIRGINGEIYPCKPDIFEKTYVRADGLAECCETCKNFEPVSNGDNACSKGYFNVDASNKYFCLIDKMQCDEWEAKTK